MLRVHGLDLSYFTGKLEGYLRAKGLPYERVEMDTRSFRRCARITGAAQMPQLELPNGQWLTDSTRIMAHLEAQTDGPAIYPQEPAVCFIAHLLEDFGDEWLWRPAMHYRWSFAPDARRASDRLARGLLRDVPLPLAWRRWLIRRRQQRRFLHNDGVNPETAAAIEQVYLDVLDAMQTCLSSRNFLLGERPTQADFGFFGAMFRHFASDPTPACIMAGKAPAVLAWVDRLWHLTPAQFSARPMPTALPADLAPLLRLACEDYLPYLDANERALEAGATRLSWQNVGVPFSTPVHRYRAWCLQQLRRHYAALHDGARQQVDAWLQSSSAALGFFAVSLLQRPAGPVVRALQE